MQQYTVKLCILSNVVFFQCAFFHMKVLIIESGRYMICEHATIHSEILTVLLKCILSASNGVYSFFCFERFGW